MAADIAGSKQSPQHSERKGEYYFEISLCMYVCMRCQERATGQAFDSYSKGVL